MSDILNMYGQCSRSLSEWTSATTIKLVLLANTYSPDQDVHDFLDDVIASEISGFSANSSYEQGGKAVINRTATYTATSNETTFDAADVTWTGSITARYGIAYVEKTSNDTSPLLFYVTFTADKTSESGNFTFQWNTSGIFTTTVT